jgi:hypothetical protein
MCSDVVPFQIQNVQLGRSEHKERLKEEKRRKKKKEKMRKKKRNRMRGIRGTS